MSNRKTRERRWRVVAAILALAGLILGVAVNVVYHPYQGMPIVWVVCNHVSNVLFTVGLTISGFIYGRCGRRR